MKPARETCEICLHRISNPVCVSCYLKHVNEWLRDFGLDANQRTKVIEKVRKRLPRETLNEHRCVICGNDEVSVCMYCAFLRTSEIILKMHLEREKINNLMEVYDFSRLEESDI